MHRLKFYLEDLNKEALELVMRAFKNHYREFIAAEREEAKRAGLDPATAEAEYISDSLNRLNCGFTIEI